MKVVSLLSTLTRPLFRIIAQNKRGAVSAFCCLFMLSASSLKAQPSQITPQKVIPPSPDAASLGKYGSTPVGLHTGIPNIDIPIYTVTDGSLQLPISISYHASGIKVSEIASWTGLGWTLNAGGLISRSVVGKSDEHGFFETTVQNSSEITESDFEFLKPFADGSGDYESDYYFYNFNGHSGKFIYEQNNHTTEFLIPKEPIVITRDGDTFWITDERGTTYFFSHTETTMLPGAVPEEITSGYYLTQITSADGKDQITLSYTQDPPYSESNLSYTETIGQDCSSGTPTGGYHNSTWVSVGRTIYPLRLSEISFSGGKVAFIKDDTRTDISSSRLAEIRIFARNADGTYETTPRKSFVLEEDYFGAGVNSRLKLKSLQEEDRTGSVIKKHSFYYDETSSLPSRTSNAQDWWGFYNGKNNSSLIATQVIGFNNFPFEVGAANREPDSTYMKTGILNKIVYPTGGYTEFFYEPHYYSGTATSLEHADAACVAGGQTEVQDEETFVPTYSGWAKIRTYCSDVIEGETPFFSRVILKENNETNPELEYFYAPYDFPVGQWPSHFQKDIWVYLNAGSTYELKVMAKGTSTSSQYGGAAFSEATVDYYQQSASSQIMAGGLRIREIRDYESATAIPLKKIYKYGTGSGPGSGVLLIPQYGVSNSKQETDVHWYAQTCGPMANSCCNVPSCFAKRMTITGSSALELTSLNGAPVVYDQVTVYESSTLSPNGKTVHKFDVQVDHFTYADKAYNNGRWQTNNSWKGGHEIWSASYLANTSTMVQKDSTCYSIFNPAEIIGTKIGWKVQMEGCTPSFQTEADMFSRLYYFDVPFYSGIKKIALTEKTTYSSAEPSEAVKVRTEYEYDNLGPNHQQLSRQITYSSNLEEHITHYWYPSDYSPSLDNFQILQNSNIIAIPVKEETHQDGNIIGGKVTRLDDFGRPVEIHQYESATPQAPPTHDANVLIPGGYAKRLDITYDATTGNIVSTQLKDNVKTSYLWGYNNSLPIAEVINADPSRASHTSFEDDGVIHAEAKTGSKVWSGVFTLALPANNDDYQLSYWQKTGSNPWVLIQQPVTVTAPGQTVNIGAAGSYVDEVRLLPPGARMTTYTYDRINGITSATDANQVTVYYDYDDFGRLKSLKDLDKNILKAYTYHYKGQ